MKKWKSVRIRQELAQRVQKEVEKSQYQNLSQFVSDAIRLRMQTLAKERVVEYLKRDRYITIPQLHAEVFYTPNHIWAQATPQETVKIGVTDYFQTQLKEVINIQTAKIGEKVSKGEPFGVAETWWFTYDLYSPLNGTIVSINRTVIDNPFVVNVDPYKWIAEVQPEQKEANSWMKGLLRLEKYKTLLPETLPGTHVSVEREGADQSWSYVRSAKKREAPNLSSSK